MPKKKTSEIDQIEAVRNLVDAYRRIYRPKGIDLDKFLADFAAYVARRLTSPGARTDFEKLCQSGCRPPVSRTDPQSRLDLRQISPASHLGSRQALSYSSQKSAGSVCHSLETVRAWGGTTLQDGVGNLTNYWQTS